MSLPLYDINASTPSKIRPLFQTPRSCWLTVYTNLSFFFPPKVQHRECCESAALNIPAIWKMQQQPQAWKRSVFIPIHKKGNAKECSNYHTIALISHASKVMLKILQARNQQYVNHELPDVQASFRKGRGTRDQIADICCIIEKQESSRKKNLPLLYWLCQSLWLCG